MTVRTVVVTGASSGIGKAVALELARRRYNVVLAGRNQEALHALVHECKDVGGDAIAVVTDVSQPDDMQLLAEAAEHEYGGFDAWINNAGVIFYSRFLDQTPDEFRTVIETNLIGTVTGSRLALNHFKSQGRGILINVGSGYGALPAPYASSYVTSKFAVRGLSASLMQELYADGIRDIHVCSVLPATIDTPVYQHSGNRMGRKVRAMPPVYPVEKAVRKIVGLLDKPKTEVTVGGIVRRGIISYALAPALFLRSFARYVKRYNYFNETDDIHEGNLYHPDSNTAVSGNWQRSGTH